MPALCNELYVHPWHLLSSLGEDCNGSWLFINDYAISMYKASRVNGSCLFPRHHELRILAELRAERRARGGCPPIASAAHSGADNMIESCLRCSLRWRDKAGAPAAFVAGSLAAPVAASPGRSHVPSSRHVAAARVSAAWHGPGRGTYWPGPLDRRPGDRPADRLWNSNPSMGSARDDGGGGVMSAWCRRHGRGRRLTIMLRLTPGWREAVIRLTICCHRLTAG